MREHSGRLSLEASPSDQKFANITSPIIDEFTYLIIGQGVGLKPRACREMSLIDPEDKP